MSNFWVEGKIISERIVVRLQKRRRGAMDPAMNTFLSAAGNGTTSFPGHISAQGHGRGGRGGDGEVEL